MKMGNKKNIKTSECNCLIALPMSCNVKITKGFWWDMETLWNSVRNLKVTKTL